MPINLGPLMWADPAALAQDQSVTVSKATDSVRDASWLLWALSGRRLHAAGTLTEMYAMPDGEVRAMVPMITLEGPAPSIETIETYDPRLDDPAEDLSAERYMLLGRKLQLLGGTGYPALRVIYEVGSNLPPGTEQCAWVLAQEHAKARNGKPTRLPNRITSTTRSGVSWTVFDPTDIIANGKSGIPEVDNWLAGQNPLAQKQKARLYRPGHPKRISRDWATVVAIETGVDETP